MFPEGKQKRNAGMGLRRPDRQADTEKRKNGARVGGDDKRKNPPGSQGSRGKRE